MDIEHIEDDLLEHGELHLVVEEHEAVLADSDEDYIGVRIGNTYFDFDAGIIEIDDGDTFHIIDAERVVYYHKPVDFPD